MITAFNDISSIGIDMSFILIGVPKMSRTKIKLNFMTCSNLIEVKMPELRPNIVLEEKEINCLDINFSMDENEAFTKIEYCLKQH